ncbi:hypothetical protein BKA67DRAFT_547809 [Truncatella angustata]|uniref:DUF7053 domain-containing protein n=1 Tax=Truncatella angustata TaxID=152316 RepID=A0A9P8UXX5_9PEZI|nr:uncharacterized protein BKA67DRAFT_547809 [Truncatella angustata]KAH6660372.1 hypothetical protein BKA67DRAFT_547809 [Truncatella angustata]
MSFLNTSATLTQATPIPLPPSRKAAAVARLHDHDFFLNTDPHITGYSPVAAADPEPTYESYKIPSSVSEKATEKKVRIYDVQDHVPNPVYSSNITSREELVNCTEGLWVRIRSPMAVVMETTWFVREKGEEMELVEQCWVSCNRMLMGIVKSSIENNWRKIHEEIVNRIVEDAKADGQS